MGRYIKQTESRSELQQRIAADMRARAEAKSKQEGGADPDRHDSPDGIDDSAYLQGTKTTTTLAPVWLIIFIAAVAAFVLFVYKANQ